MTVQLMDRACFADQGVREQGCDDSAREMLDSTASSEGNRSSAAEFQSPRGSCQCRRMEHHRLGIDPTINHPTGHRWRLTGHILRARWLCWHLLLLGILRLSELLSGGAALNPGVVAAEPFVTAATWTPDQRHVIVGSQAGARWFAWPSGEPLGAIPTELAHIHDLKFSPDGEFLLLAGGEPAERGRVELVRWATRERVRTIGGHGDVVYRVAWSPDAQVIASAGGDGICRVTRVADGQPVSQYLGHALSVLDIRFWPAVEPGGSWRILSGGADHTLQLWEANTARTERSWDNHLGALTAVSAPGPDLPAGKRLIATAGEDRTVRLWQPELGRLVRFAKLAAVPRAIAWSGDGQELVVGADDGHLYRMRVETAEITSSQKVLPGRILEIAPDASGRNWLVGGETGYRVVAF